MKTTALITGASSGIGLELAKIHAAKGGDLLLVARNIERLNELKTELESRYKVSVVVLQKDLSLSESAIEVYQEVLKREIQVDILINNAGFGDFGEFKESNYARFTEMIELNVRTLTQLTHLFLKAMSKQGHGRILNLASVAAFQSGPLMAVYYATKAYVLSFSEAVSYELRNTGITLTTLCPGPTTSGFSSAASLGNSKLFNSSRIPSSLEVATMGYEAMLKGKSVVIHGWKYQLLIFMQRFIPRSWSLAAIGKIQGKLS